MGFDLYGVKPHNPDNLVKPEIDHDTWETLSEEEQQKHWDADTEYHNKVVGEYFRNNAWWWRPLWEYVCHFAGELLDDKDKKYGQSNDGHLISNKKANYIGIKLLDLVNSGHAEEYQEEYMQRYEIAKEHNKEIKKASDILQEIVKDKVFRATVQRELLTIQDSSEYVDKVIDGDLDLTDELHKLEEKHKEIKTTSIAPCDYPEKEKADWDELQAQRNWDSMYPFSVENVEEFSHFCMESGGFRIC